MPSCPRCQLPFFSRDGHTMCYRCREDAAITSLGGVALFGNVERQTLNKLDERRAERALEVVHDHAELIATFNELEAAVVAFDEKLAAGDPELENTVAVDHETTQRCSFCQRAIVGVRVLITKAGTTWVQVAAGAWVGVPAARITSDGHFEVRCAQCLLPEV